MKKRQMRKELKKAMVAAKKPTVHKLTVKKPTVQEAWDVVSEYLATFHKEAPCFFVDYCSDGYKKACLYKVDGNILTSTKKVRG